MPPVWRGITFWAAGGDRGAGGQGSTSPIRPSTRFAKITASHGNDEAALVRDRVGAAIGLSDATGGDPGDGLGRPWLLEASPSIDRFWPLSTTSTGPSRRSWISSSTWRPQPAQHPVLMLCIARPKPRETRPSGTGRNRHHALALDPAMSEI